MVSYFLKEVLGFFCFITKTSPCLMTCWFWATWQLTFFMTRACLCFKGRSFSLSTPLTVIKCCKKMTYSFSKFHYTCYWIRLNLSLHQFANCRGCCLVDKQSLFYELPSFGLQTFRFGKGSLWGTRPEICKLCLLSHLHRPIRWDLSSQVHLGSQPCLTCGLTILSSCLMKILFGSLWRSRQSLKPLSIHEKHC